MLKQIFRIGCVAIAVVALSPFIYQSMSVTNINIANAASTSTSAVITLNVTTGITISTATSTVMSQSLGVAANTATASTTWNVKTNNSAGYTLSVAASTAPAMANSTTTISDYPTSTPVTWGTGFASGYTFGYSAFGTQVPTGTWGTGANCFTGTVNTISTTLLYRGFATTTNQIATNSATTTTNGDNATVCYAVEQKGSYIPSGTYTATITATAVTL